MEETLVEEQKEKYILSGFTAWCVLKSFGLKSTFEEYCQQLNLRPGTTKTAEEKVIDKDTAVQKALENANKIISLDAKRTRKNNG